MMNASCNGSSNQDGTFMNNQADFLPTSSQSPGHSPQPSPDSQQKDLGVSAPPPQAQYPLKQRGVLQHHLQLSPRRGQQQDQHVSQSGLTQRYHQPRPVAPSGHEALPHMQLHGGGNLNNNMNAMARPAFSPRNVSSSQQTFPHGSTQSKPPLTTHYNQHYQKQQHPLQHPPLQQHSQTAPRQQQPQQRMPSNPFPHISNPAVADSGQHSQPNQRLPQLRFSSHQQRFQPQQQPRPHQVHRPGAQNRPPYQPQQPQLSQQHSSPARMPAAPSNQSQGQQGMTAQNRVSGPAAGSHPNMVQPGHDLYSEHYEDDESYMEEGGMYPEDYEGEEEDFEEEMEGDYNYPGVPYDDYMSSGSEDLSEEESNLFEELSQLDQDDPRYTEVFNRLRDKGVDTDEINEIVNPGRHLYASYGEDMDDFEDQRAGMGDTSSFNQIRMAKQVNVSQAASNLQEASAMPNVPGIQRVPQTQNSNVHKTLMATANQKQNANALSTSPVAQPGSQPQVRVQHQQQQQQQVLLGFVSNSNQPRKVFQSPMPSSQPASGPRPWQQKGPEMSAQHHPRQPSNTQGFSQQLSSPGKPRVPIRPPGPRLQRPQNPTTQHGVPTGHIPRQAGAHQQVSSTGMPQQLSFTQPQQGVRNLAPRPVVHGHRMSLPGGSALQRPSVPPQNKPRGRGVRLPVPRAAPMRPTMPISQACQSRLEVQQMQELLDKEIMAKKKVTGPSVTPCMSHPVQPVAQAPTRQAAPMLRQQLSQPRFPSPTIMPQVRPQGTTHAQQAPTSVVASSIAVRPRGPVPPVNQGFQQPLVVAQTRVATPATVAIATPRLPPPQFRPNTPGADSSTKLPHENLQAQQSRGPSFNVSALKEEKCKVLSPDGKRQDLVRNKMYKIKSPIDQSMIYAIWNGEKFEDANINSAGATQSTSVPNVSTSQVTTTVQQLRPEETALVSPKPKPKVSFTSASESAFQEQFLQTLGKSSKTKQASSTMEPDTNSNKGDSMMQTSGKETIPNSSKQTTYVKPLSQETVARAKPGEEEDENEDDDDDNIFKKPFSENEDVFRVCYNCGTTSKDFKTCDGCQKVFQGEMKIHCVKKGNAKDDKMLSQPSTSKGGSLPMQDMKPSDRFRQVMSKASTFYGNNGAPRGVRGAAATSRRGMGRTRGGGLRGKLALEDEGEYPSSEEESEEKKGAKKRQGKPKAKTATPRKRSKKTDEPVTVTISSDEDEPSSTSNMFPGFASSPASSAGSGSPIFTANQMNPVNAFGRFRRLCMEDEEGNSKLNKKLKQTRREPAQQALLEEDGEDEEEYEEDEDSDDPAVYQIDIRSIRIGSMRTQPEAPMLISLHGICFRCRAERSEEEFECEIMCQEVEHVKFYGGQPQPLLFLFLSLEGGEKLRNICHMEAGGDEYFDPSSTDMKQKMIVIIIEPHNETPLEMMRENITLWADMNHQEENKFLQELSSDAANDLLIQSAPPMLTTDVERDFMKFKKRYITEEGERQIVSAGVPGSPPEQADNEPDSTSSSPPDVRSHFYGPPIKLLRYPPPPASGISITTEDLMCLAEGEFLNDVVIDFYLQYLYKEKLSEENQKRTHIFSSFFYKRLTQRDRHNERSEEESKKSLPERRHARVKKWTKTVDLFSKDFIIVPINEHSHWYLAVICFPGLANPEVVPYIPNPAHTADPEESQNDTAGSEDGASSKEEGKSSQGTFPKRTVFGRHLKDDENDKSDEGKLIGQKLPCILMFDSLAGPNRNTNVKMLREYLQCEWDAKKSEPRQITKIMRGTTPKVPQQSNFSDCGVFLLQYVESFFEDPIADFQVPMKGLQDWFHEELVFHKRREIHELIMGLHQLFMEERGDPNILDIPYDSTPMQPPSLHPMPGPSSQDHFLGQPEDYGDMSGMREDENSNSSSAAWDMKTEQMGLYPVALRQNTMFEGEESNSSSLPSKAENTEEEEEDKSQKASSATVPDNKPEEDSIQQDHQSSETGEKAVMETLDNASDKDLLDAAEEKIHTEDEAKADTQTETPQNESKTLECETDTTQSGADKEQTESSETHVKDSPADKSDSITAEQLKHGL